MGALGTYTDSPTITDRQRDYLVSLTTELFRLSATILGTDTDADRDVALALIPGMSKNAASDRIGSLRNEILPVMRQTARGASYASQTVEPPADTVELDTDGIYVLDGGYYRVRRSQAGRLYALVLDTSSRRWEYARGVVGRIRPEHRITAEHAATLPFSWCIRCAKELSREDSIARRMGLVCYGKSIG